MKNIVVIQDGGRTNGDIANLNDSFTKGVERSLHTVEVEALLI